MPEKSRRRRFTSGLLILGVLLVASALGGSLQASEDTTAPSLLGFSIQPQTINTGIGAKELSLTLYLIDLESGASGDGETQLRFCSPSGNQSVLVSLYHGVAGQPDHLIEGTAQNGLWRVPLTMPKGSEPGRWRLEYCFLADQVGNWAVLYPEDLTAQGMPTGFWVSNGTHSLRLPLTLRMGPPPTPTPIPSPLPTVPIGGPPVPPDFGY